MSETITWNYNNLQLRWLEALKGSKYKQGGGALSHDGHHCCLGVACDLAERELGMKRTHPMGENDEEDKDIILWNDEEESAPKVLMEALKLKGDLGEFYEKKELPEGNEEILKFLEGLTKKYGATSLAELNDNGRTFVQVAAFIEKNPNIVFKP